MRPMFATTLLLATSLLLVLPSPALPQTKTDNAATLDFINGDEDYIVLFRPSLLVKEKSFRDLVKTGNVKRMIEAQSRSMEKLTGVEIEGVDQVTLIGSMTSGATLNIYRIKEKQGFDALVEKAEEKDDDGFTYYRNKRRINGMRYFHVADRQTIVWSSEQKMLSTLRDRRKDSKAAKAPWRVSWRNFENDRIVFVYGRKYIDAIRSSPIPEPYNNLMKPMLTAQYVMGSLAIESKVKLFAEIQVRDKETAKQAKESADELAKLAREMLKQVPQDSMPEEQKTYMDFANKALDSCKINVEGDRLVGSLTLDIDIKAMAELIAAQFGAATRTVSANNIRQLGIAMHTYHDANRSLPPAVIVSESGHRHSWRVAILPFLGENELYKRYRFDEPWNSRHNKEVTSEIPEVFKHPDSDPDSLYTNYFVVVGDGTVFDGDEGISLGKITDGTSRTIMLIEGKQKTHWAEPEDVPFDARKIKSMMGGFTEGGSNVVFCDCSTHFIANSIDTEMLYKLFTRSGGDVVDMSKLGGGK